MYSASAAICLCGQAQEAGSGASVPITVSGNAFRTRGIDGDDAPGTSTTAGFRAVVSPGLTLGPHWFLYAAFDAHSQNYFLYGSGLDKDRRVHTSLMQGFFGYTTAFRKATLLVKAGQLSSAFGFFPVQYDDAKTAFPTPPPGYVTNLPLRPDQLPCGVNDLLVQPYGGDVTFNCGGSRSLSYGTLPNTLYGLPGIELEISTAHTDARVQMTNSSPANPQTLLSNSQFLQWTAGGGYTIRGGLRVGLSAFRGPYLDRILAPLLPAGKALRNFPATGIGTDVQWARGRWSVEGEWQHFHFDLPGFVASPSESFAYAQLKSVLSPRTFVAVRASAFTFSRVQDTSGTSANPFVGPEQVYELAFGFRPNHYQLLKTGFEWLNRPAWSSNDWYWPQTRGSGLEVQLVTAFTPLSKAFR